MLDLRVAMAMGRHASGGAQVQGLVSR